MSNPSKILVVVGDSASRKNFEQILSGKGYAVTTASNGEDALWQLVNEKFDVLFADKMLRGMSGMDLAEEIHDRLPGLPVVIITDDKAGVSQQRAATIGVAEFLHKPFSPEQFADTAERILRSTQSASPLQSAMPVAEVASAPAVNAGPLSRLKGIVLFLLAPFIGLAYLIAFPVAVLSMFGWEVLQQPDAAESQHPADKPKPSFLKSIVMMLTVFVVGVFYVVLGPIIGIGVLLWFGFQAWGKVGAKAMGS